MSAYELSLQKAAKTAKFRVHMQTCYDDGRWKNDPEARCLYFEMKALLD